MTLVFPSAEFDNAVAGVCHGSVTESEVRALNVLLRSNPAARDQYLFYVELHGRLASDPDLFSRPANTPLVATSTETGLAEPRNILPLKSTPPTGGRRWASALALAACLVLIAALAWTFWLRPPVRDQGTTAAVAMLTRSIDARWARSTGPLPVGAALEPGSLRLESGLAQVVFYSGARIVMEGPAELQLVSSSEAICPAGRLLAEVPPPARGFRLKTSQLNVLDLGTAFGVDAQKDRTEVHVFKGQVEVLPATANATKRSLEAGQAASVRGGAAPQLMSANTADFASLFEFQQRSLAAEAFRYEQWQFANAQLNQDPTLLVHLDFENLGSTDWTLRNAAEKNRSVPEATVVGCVRAEGRWREKQALEFQNVNDRVRMVVPGEFEALTVSTWVCLKGLNRQFNSLFMSDGFEPGTIHWLIRNDRVLGLTVFGSAPRQFEIVASPPVASLGNFGMWQHLAAVVDTRAGQVVHYLNGVPVSRHTLKLRVPLRVGSAELGNWNARGGSNPAQSLIRNLSGSLDEFELFSRALSDAEIRALYAKGKPDL